MPEVVRGSRVDPALAHLATTTSGLSGTESRPSFHQQQSQDEHLATARSFSPSNTHESAVVSTSPPPLRHVAFRAESNGPPTSPHPMSQDRRRSSTFFRNNSETRPEADAYYDSRAATKREWRRRATTLQDYYHENPELLPQLPFTWHRGKKRWRLIMLIIFMWIDACVVPIALYYGMKYGGNIQGWIIFAVVTTVWGGPTYLEFAVRTFKLMKKERFYRPLGTTSRWSFDYLTWVSSSSIFVVTALFVIGSAPHIVWLRVLCMPMPALLYALGIFVGFPTLYHWRGWKTPFRISGTDKGEVPKPAVYYFIEDTVAVNANAGRPYREALAARYEASPRWRRMMYTQSIFWSIPPFIIAAPLTVIACIHAVPPFVAYAICWAVPFIWATIWALISMAWCKRDMVREREEWESSQATVAQKIQMASQGLDTETSSSAPQTADSGTEMQQRQTTPEQAV